MLLSNCVFSLWVLRTLLPAPGLKGYKTLGGGGGIGHQASDRLWVDNLFHLCRKGEVFMGFFFFYHLLVAHFFFIVGCSRSLAHLADYVPPH